MQRHAICRILSLLYAGYNKSNFKDKITVNVTDMSCY